MQRASAYIQTHMHRNVHTRMNGRSRASCEVSRSCIYIKETSEVYTSAYECLQVGRITTLVRPPCSALFACVAKRVACLLCVPQHTSEYL